MAWDKTKPANNSDLLSPEIRANWDALDAALMAPLAAAPPRTLFVVNAADQFVATPWLISTDNQLLAPDGTPTAPAYAFASLPGVGAYLQQSVSSVFYNFALGNGSEAWIVADTDPVYAMEFRLAPNGGPQAMLGASPTLGGYVGSGGDFALHSAATPRWRIPATGGHLNPAADNTIDIGAASLQVRNLYVGTQIKLGGGRVYISTADSDPNTGLSVVTQAGGYLQFVAQPGAASFYVQTPGPGAIGLAMAVNTIGGGQAQWSTAASQLYFTPAGILAGNFSIAFGDVVVSGAYGMVLLDGITGLSPGLLAGPWSGLYLPVMATPPGTPPAGFVSLYAKADKRYYQKDSTGLETLVGGVAWPLLAPDGTAAAPSYSFAAAPTTGIAYNLMAAGDLGFVVGGVPVMVMIGGDPSIVSTDANLYVGRVFVPDGTAAAPSYSWLSDPTWGIFFTGSSIQVAVAGISKWQFSGDYFYPTTDNAYDVGVPGIAPRSVYAAASFRGPATGGSLSNPMFTFLPNADSGMYAIAGGSIVRFGQQGTLVAGTLVDAGLGLWQVMSLDIGFAGDTKLYRDTAGILAQRNGANPQTFRLYEALDGGGNGSWLEFQGNSTMVILSRLQGTGPARALSLGTQGSAPVSFRVDGAVRWLIDTNFYFYPAADNAYDIGGTTLRPKSIYAGTMVQVLDPAAGGHITLDHASAVVAELRSDRVIQLTQDGMGLTGLKVNWGTLHSHYNLVLGTEAYPDTGLGLLCLSEPVSPITTPAPGLAVMHGTDLEGTGTKGVLMRSEDGFIQRFGKGHQLPVLSVAPATPPTGYVVSYAKTDKKMYQKDDAGLETILTANNPMTTPGDLIRGGTAGTPTRLGIGSNGQVLTLASGLPEWVALPVDPGFANPMTASGDMIYGGASGAPTRLPKSTDGMFLRQVAGIPAWFALPSDIVDLPLEAARFPDGTANNLYPMPNERISTGTPASGVPKLVELVYQFDATVQEFLIWKGRIPKLATGGVVLVVKWSMITATSGNIRISCGLGVALEASGDVRALVTPAPTVSADQAVPGTLGQQKETRLTLTGLTNIAEDRKFVCTVSLYAGSASSATGDRVLEAAWLEFAR